MLILETFAEVGQSLSTGIAGKETSSSDQLKGTLGRGRLGGTAAAVETKHFDS